MNRPPAGGPPSRGPGARGPGRGPSRGPGQGPSQGQGQGQGRGPGQDRGPNKGPRPPQAGGKPGPAKAPAAAKPAAPPNRLGRESASARQVALDLLDGVLNRKRPLDDVLADHRGVGALERRDRGFARMVAATVLRRLGRIDAALTAMLPKPLAECDPAALLVLRAALAELWFLEAPPHAAVHEAVSLIEAEGLPHLKGLINAVLRRATREKDALLSPDPLLDLPDWIRAAWVAAYGEDTARAIAKAIGREPSLDLTVLDPAGPAVWAEKLEARQLPNGSLRREFDGPVTELPGFDDGAWQAQDAAAALPATLLGDVAGKRVLDLCAAPGGKTAQLAAAGALVTAVDRSPQRLKRVTQNLQRLKLSAEIIAADGAAWTPDARFDAVLVDAPCTATGTARRRPDVLRLKQPQDVDSLAATQDRLLDAALNLVVPGGVVVFCTCSLQPEEGEQRWDALRSRHPQLIPDPIRAEEVGGDPESVTARGELRLLPSHWAKLGGLDGFYAVRFRTLS